MLGSRKVRAAAARSAKNSRFSTIQRLRWVSRGFCPTTLPCRVALGLLHRHRIAPYGPKSNLIANLRLGEGFLKRAL